MRISSFRLCVRICLQLRGKGTSLEPELFERSRLYAVLFCCRLQVKEGALKLVSVDDGFWIQGSSMRSSGVM